MNLVFECVSANEELAPTAYIVGQRALSTRGIVVKHVGLNRRAAAIIKRHHSYRKPVRAQRPLKLYNCTLGTDFGLRCDCAVPTRTLAMQWQNLSWGINSIVARSGATATDQRRTFSSDLGEIDKHTVTSVVNSLGHKGKHVFKHVPLERSWMIRVLKKPWEVASSAQIVV